MTIKVEDGRSGRHKVITTDSSRNYVVCTDAEWSAFVQDVKDGKYDGAKGS